MIIAYNYEYLLTPLCRVLLEKLTGLQLVKKFPAFHGTRRIITALTIVRHLSLSWANPIQSIYPHSTSWRSILILSTHLRLGLPSGLLHSGFPSKTLHTPSPHPYAPHAQPISFFFPSFSVFYLLLYPFYFILFIFICFFLFRSLPLLSLPLSLLPHFHTNSLHFPLSLSLSLLFHATFLLSSLFPAFFHTQIY